jgi:hypothetical protein
VTREIAPPAKAHQYDLSIRVVDLPLKHPQLGQNECHRRSISLPDTGRTFGAKQKVCIIMIKFLKEGMEKK